MYLAATRPDLMYVLSSINRFMNCPTELHMNDVKRVHIYLKGTVDLGIMHKRNGIEKPEAYTDCGYTGDLDDRKSTFEYVFMLEAQSHGSLESIVVLVIETLEMVDGLDHIGQPTLNHFVGSTWLADDGNPDPILLYRSISLFEI